MLKLPNVTLIAVTGKDFDAHDVAIKKSCEGIEWGDVKIIYDYKLKNIDSWNHTIVYDLHKYIDTDFAFLVHADGYVVRPDLWKEEFLDYDYIGAPWPLPVDNYSYRDEVGDLVRVGNSVSIRSKKLMELVAQREWKSYYGNTNEDGFICCHNRKWLESKGCSYAPLDVAKHFSKEHNIPENEGLSTFAFHSL